MENTYKHSEMVRIVEEFFEAHDYPIVTVLDATTRTIATRLAKTSSICSGVTTRILNM